MVEFLFLFHSTVGVVQTRKLLQAAGVPFRVADIPAPCVAAAGYAFVCNAHPAPNNSGCCPAQRRRFTAEEKRLNRWPCISRTGKMAPCGLMPSPPTHGQPLAISPRIRPMALRLPGAGRVARIRRRRIRENDRAAAISWPPTGLRNPCNITFYSDNTAP
jgi:hypothetical protein